MRRTAAIVLVVVLAARPGWAWGAGVHRFVMGQAIGLLPPEVAPFFEKHRTEIVIRVNDPDLWRVVGWDEAPHHFLDFGAPPYGSYPFAALPRDYEAALAKFGAATLREYGVLPWREAEMVEKLTGSFERLVKRAPYAESDAIVFAAAAAHYLQDAYQPLHAHINYDGQQSGQRGVHARFESELFERFGTRLTIRPSRPTPMKDPRSASFDVLLESYQLVDDLLAADRAAREGRAGYDDAYFEAFFGRTRPVLERRVSESITATAAMIIGAWQRAGAPDLGSR